MTYIELAARHAVTSPHMHFFHRVTNQHLNLLKSEITSYNILISSGPRQRISTPRT